jgi:hypothetical protein
MNINIRAWFLVRKIRATILNRFIKLANKRTLKNFNEKEYDMWVHMSDDCFIADRLIALKKDEGN